MELRHLRYFIVVAEELSYTRAAARLHVSAPPLSVQIKQLQVEVGHALIVCIGRALHLTDAGRVFLERARHIIGQVDEAVVLARQAACGKVGELTIGYNPVAEHSVLTQIVRAFSRLSPDIRITLRSLRTPQQVEALARNELDLGFVCPPLSTDDLETHFLTEQPFVALLPKHHRLANHTSVPFSALSDEPLVICSRTLDPDAYRQLQDEFSRVHAAFNVALELESARAMIDFVVEGAGCGIAPEYVRALCPSSVVCRPLESQGLKRVLAVAKQRDRGGLVESFCQFAIAQSYEIAAVSASLRPQVRAGASGRALRPVAVIGS